MKENSSIQENLPKFFSTISDTNGNHIDLVFQNKFAAIHYSMKVFELPGVSSVIVKTEDGSIILDLK